MSDPPVLAVRWSSTSGRWIHRGLLIDMNADGDLVVEGEEDGELRTIDALEAKYLDIKAQHPDGRWLPIGHPVIAAYFAEEES